MLNQKLLDEISTKVNDLVAQSPVKDVEKNLRVLLAGVFTRLDLVTRDEFNVQQEMLMRTREKLTKLEARVVELEDKPKVNKTTKVNKTRKPKKT
jgi:BMFP domain-containing protein YqiC